MTEIPDSVVRMHPYIKPSAWVRLSEHRFRAEHPNAQAAVLAVTMFGETVARGVKAGMDSERAVFADLIGLAGQLAVNKAACEEGTPVVRPDNEANAGVVGRCWWCGSYPSQHVRVDDTEADR
jgi:hypothetical protein